MCGIAGIVSKSRVNAIYGMAQALQHRGPDGEGYYLEQDVALAHKRLSIVDLEGGKQPISNESGNLHLVCNGEIYNSPSLRRELEGRGHHFKTKTDVEVILHLYEDEGEACVRRLRGMFAFAIWDRDRRRLFLARDHLGQKPLFYVEGHDELLFASEVKSLLGVLDRRRRVDMEALWHYMSMRFVPDDRSFFLGIKKLPSASTLSWDEGRICTRRYWKADFRTKHAADEDVLIDGLDALLDETIRLHRLSDVSVGAFLSGGIDSSLVAAIMARQADRPISTFSIGVKEQAFNELPFARRVSDCYGMDAHERVVEADLVGLMPQMIYHMDEPSDPFGVGVFLVSRLAAEHVKVVLGGDGGDENFAGYDRFVGQQLVDYYGMLPRWIRRDLVGRLIRYVPESFGYKSIAQKLRWLNDMSFYSAGDRYARSMSFLRFTHEHKNILFTEKARAEIFEGDSAGKILGYFQADNAEELVDRMLFTDLMTRIPDHLLMIVDRMAMAHSLEVRSPLIDYLVVEYAAAIPSKLKLKKRRLKYVLRRVAERYLPNDVVYRPKQGFGFPIGLWLKGELRPFMERVLAESRFVSEGLFERDAVAGMMTEHLSGRCDHSYRLWMLLNLELWYRMYFEGQTVDAAREWTKEVCAA